MTNQEIKTQLESIIAKINDQVIGAWSSNLEYTTEAVIIEDVEIEDCENMPYNGWLSDLELLITKL